MNAAAPQPQGNMGQPEARIDGRLKVLGAAKYPSDMAVENPAFAVLVTSGIAKGQITTLDLAGARSVPGVLEIFTHENTGALKPVPRSDELSASTSIQSLGPEIAHDGQIIAMVVAETFEAAREAAYRVQVSYKSERPSATFGSPGVTEEALDKKFPAVGDVDAALAQADMVLEAEYGTPTQHHNPMELFTTTCEWKGDRLRVFEPSQFVYGLKNNLAKRLGIDPDDIDVLSPYVGGAFGSKGQMTPRTSLVALAAKVLGRAVKLVPARDQGFTIATYRAETQHRIRLGARKDGKIVAFEHDGKEITSRPDPYSVSGVQDSARMYDFGAVRTTVSIVHADRNTPGFMRSPPVVPYIYALESAMDELAVKLGMDPVQLRRVNDTQKDPISGKPYSSRSLMQCYDQAAQAFGWLRRKSAPGAMQDSDWLIGWGCASAVYPTHTGPAVVRVRLSPDGKVMVQTACHDIGTGAYTVIGQTAADGLGLSLGDVDVQLGDSSLPAGPVAGGSNTTASACSAVLQACAAMREKIFRAATTQNKGALAGQSMASLKLADGRVIGADGHSVPLTELLADAGLGEIDERAEFVPHGVKPDAAKNLSKGKMAFAGGSHGDKLMYAMGAEFVEVRINKRTCEIRVPRIVGAFAGGRIVNPRTARSQLMGGMIWGISSALHEATEIDKNAARYVNDNFADYLIPVNADVGEVEVIFVPEEDHEVNPAGVKGLGELANVGTAAAIANAVYHATGKRIRQLPLRIENLL